MGRTRTGRTTACVVLAAAGLLAAGCGGTKHPAAASVRSGSPTSGTLAAATSDVTTALSPATTAPAASTVPASPGTSAARSVPGTPIPATPSTAAAVTPTVPTAPAGCRNFAACGFPDAAATGSRLTKLTPKSGDIEVRTDGAVISGWDLHGSLDVYANNVTIVDSRITSTNWWGVNVRTGFGGLKVLHTTIVGSSTLGLDNGGTDYGVSNNGSGPLEVGWCDISQFGAAVSTGHGIVHDNYAHDQANFVNLGHEWVHTDSIISGGADTRGLTIRHNTLINATPVDKGASASVGLFPDGGPVANTVVDDNWLAGGAYAFYGGDAGATGIVVTNNFFSTELFPNGGVYGFVAHWNAGGHGNVWTGNRTPDGRAVTPQT